MIDQKKYCVICYFAGSDLTASVYVLDVENSIQALKESEMYFAENFQTIGTGGFGNIKRIEVLPDGANRYSGKDPVFWKNY